MPWFIPVAMAAASGIMNLISGSEKARQEKQRRDQAVSMLEKNFVDDKSLSNLLDQNKQMFNQGLISTLNSSAISSRGFANSGVVGAAVAGGIKGQELSSASKITGDVMSENKRTSSQIASVIAGTDVSDNQAGNFLTGAIGGLTAGMELDKLANPKTPGGLVTDPSGNADKITPFKPDIPDYSGVVEENKDINGPIGQSGMVNPHWQGLDQDNYDPRTRLNKYKFN